jgi:DNA-binding transcriptional LysR family regulator
MLDVRRLRLLAALERLGTIAAVADELHLTAPGVSMQLAALEREIGMDVTERRGRRVALTPAGRLLAAHGRDLLDRLSLADLEVDALRRGAAGAYRLAAFPSAARTFVADVWRRFLADGAGLELSLSTPEPEEALASLTAGEADLAVVHAYSNVPRALPSAVEVASLAVEPVWLAIRTDDPAAGDEVDLGELAAHGWVAPTADRTCFEMTERVCGLAGFRPRVVAESMDFAVLLELVAAGAGVALVPDLTVAAVPTGVRLTRIRSAPHRTISAAMRTTSRSDPGVQRLTALLRDAARARVRDAAPEPA